MALHIQSSFAAGEIDPSLQERTTFEKYQSGLNTARNVAIGKTGRVLSRQGRSYVWTTKLPNRKCLIYSVPNTGMVLEWGHLYVRTYSISNNYGYSYGELVDDSAHSLTEADLPNIQFENNQGNVYIFCQGKPVLKYQPQAGGGFFPSIFALPTIPSALTYVIGGTGYPVDYALTVVIGGQESPPAYFNSTTAMLKPIVANNEFNKVTGTIGLAAQASLITEMRVYRRPHNAGAFGYIGSSSQFTVSGLNLTSLFQDNGQDADYTHSPPSMTNSVTNRGASGPDAFDSATGTIYQQRLILTNIANLEEIDASRPNFQNNFTRDYPLGADSALTFKSGTSGQAAVLRMIDSNGLVVFTTVGIFLHQGEISPTNLSLDKKGNWVIDPSLAPIGLPGNVLFYDKSTNTIRSLGFSYQLQAYTGEDLSVFSDHLFLYKKIVSWTFQNGPTPLLWVVFNDGTFCSLTYEPNQAMKAWTRHDSDPNSGLLIEGVTSGDLLGTTMFLVNKNGIRYVEQAQPRYVDPITAASNSESDKSNVNALMDSMVSWQNQLNSVVANTVITVRPLDNATWDGTLVLQASADVFLAGQPGDVGTLLRYFDPADGTSLDMTVISRVDNRNIQVTPNKLFPSEQAVNTLGAQININVYATAKVFTGLDHMNGEFVSIMMDGYVYASPNNDIDNLDLYQVVNGSVTLNDPGAIVHIGRPITCDVQTLDIDTVEQRPILLESKIVNRIYMKVIRSRGLYIGSSFPSNNKVNGMNNVEEMDVDYTQSPEILGNRYTAPQTKRYELSIPGDWKSQGKVCIRQVDPIHFEILSIVPDVEDLRR